MHLITMVAISTGDIDLRAGFSFLQDGLQLKVGSSEVSGGN